MLETQYSRFVTFVMTENLQKTNNIANIDADDTHKKVKK